MASAQLPSEEPFVHDFTEAAIVRVGDSKKEFSVHKSFLTGSSKFFQAAMQKSWAEGQTRIIELPEIKAATFNSYLHWLYIGTLAEYGTDLPQYDWCTNKTTSEKHKTLAGARYQKLCDIAILADVLDESRLRDAVVDAFLLTNSRLYFQPGGSHIEQLWAHLPPTSKLRMMLVDKFATSSSLDLYETKEHCEKLPFEFVLAVLVATKRENLGLNKLVPPTFQNREVYHENRGGQKRK